MNLLFGVLVIAALTLQGAQAFRTAALRPGSQERRMPLPGPSRAHASSAHTWPSALRNTVPGGARRRLTHVKAITPPTLVEAAAAAVNAAKPDGYVYGSVAAPDWALPVGLVLIIATAAVPLLLTPGEKALDSQREDEATKGVQFGRKKKDDV